MDPVADVTEIEGQGSDPTTGMSNPFSNLATALFAAAWLMVMFDGWGAHIGSDPTSWLQYPAQTAARVIDRDLEAAAAVDRIDPERGIRHNLYGSYEDVLEASIEIQRDAANTVTSLVDSGYESVDQMHWANARLSVLLAESGRYDEAMEAAEESEGAQIEAARAALASSLQSEEGKEQGARLLRRSDAMTAANALMIAAGVLVLIALARGTVRLEAPVPLVVPWSMSLGFAVIVRADFWNRLYFLSLAYLEELHSGSEWLGPLYTWGTLIASLPMLWLIYRYLLPSTPGALLEPFGLDVRSLRWRKIAKIAGAIVSINFLGTTVIAWGSWGLGFEGHWAEGLDESLIWGSARELIETSIDYVVLTPVLEEILFRGLLFFTLRNRFGAWQAALLSSLLFSAVHFYSLPGFLMTFWSGFVWAIGFERAHSLLPGIIAHAIYNSFFVAGIVLIYR